MWSHTIAVPENGVGCVRIGSMKYEYGECSFARPPRGKHWLNVSLYGGRVEAGAAA